MVNFDWLGVIGGDYMATGGTVLTLVSSAVAITGSGHAISRLLNLYRPSTDLALTAVKWYRDFFPHLMEGD